MLHLRITVKSPKSCAFPVDAIVIKSMVFVLFPDPLDCGWPPPNVPPIRLVLPERFLLATVKSPKSVAFHSAVIVTYSITLEVSGDRVGDDPPAHTPRIPLDTAVLLFTSTLKLPNLVPDPLVANT